MRGFLLALLVAGGAEAQTSGELSPQPSRSWMKVVGVSSHGSIVEKKGAMERKFVAALATVDVVGESCMGKPDRSLKVTLVLPERAQKVRKGMCVLAAMSKLDGNAVGVAPGAQLYFVEAIVVR